MKTPEHPAQGRVRYNQGRAIFEYTGDTLHQVDVMRMLQKDDTGYVKGFNGSTYYVSVGLGEIYEVCWECYQKERELHMCQTNWWYKWKMIIRGLSY